MQLPPITIWMHGTLPEHLVPLFSHIPIDAVHEFFFCKPGLHRADSYDPKYHHYAIAKLLDEQAPTTFPLEHIYIYGWSGKWDGNERIRCAHLLYAQLQPVISEYKKMFNAFPPLRIITHSHGGNVALNLARVETEDDFFIEELILLAVPVQTETSLFINEPMFKNIYSIHSHWDILQVADPHGWPEIKNKIKKIFNAGSLSFESAKEIIKTLEEKELFSKRHFKPRKNLVQAHVSYEHRDLLHIEFLMLPFVKELPSLLTTIKKWQAGTISLPEDQEDVCVELEHE